MVRVVDVQDTRAALHETSPTYVYAFDHKHRRPPMEYKDLLGGKGANLAEMTSVLKLPVPPGFTISTDACRAYMHVGLAAGPRRRDRRPRRQAGEDDGPAAGRPVRPAARQRPLRRQVLDARDDGHRPQPRPQRQERQGLAAATDDERFAYDSYRRFIAMYGRIVLGVDGAEFEHPFEHGEGDGRRHQRRRDPGRGAEGAVRDVQGRRQGADRQAVPAGPDEAAARRRRGGVQELERRPGEGLPRPGADQPRPRHGRQRPGDGVRQPRRQLGHGRRVHPQRGDGGEQALRRLPDQRPGRGRRRRHPQHRGPRRAGQALPRDPRRAAGDLRPPRAPLPGHVRHRVHDRAGQALDAADPRRQAHRRRRPADGRRHDQGHGQGRRASGRSARRRR